RLTGRNLEVTVLDALKLGARVFDLTDGDALVERRGAPVVVGVRHEGHVLLFFESLEEERTTRQRDEGVVGRAGGLVGTVPRLGDLREPLGVFVLDSLDEL